MDQRYHTFSFGHYHQAPGASCSILYILKLSCLLSFLCNPYIPFLIYKIFHLLVYIGIAMVIQHLTCTNFNFTFHFHFKKIGVILVIGASVSEHPLGSSTCPLSVCLYISYVSFWPRGGPRATRKRKAGSLKAQRAHAVSKLQTGQNWSTVYSLI